MKRRHFIDFPILVHLTIEFELVTFKNILNKFTDVTQSALIYSSN